MDDMQRYREIKAEADPEDPAKQLLASIAVSCDQALAEAIRLERQGRTGKVRALGFTETADLLDQPFTDDDIEHLAAAVRVRIGWPISHGEAHTIVTAIAQELAATGRHRGKATPVEGAGRA